MDRRSFLKSAGSLPAIAALPHQDPIDAEKPIWFGTRFVEPGKEPTLEWLEYGEVRVRTLSDRVQIKLTNESSAPLSVNFGIRLDEEWTLQDFIAQPREAKMFERIGNMPVAVFNDAMFLDRDMVDYPPAYDELQQAQQFLVGKKPTHLNGE